MLNKLMKLKNKKGFTLVELIVVIAIIAILTAIIVPLVGRYSAQARYTTLQDAASTISNSVNNGLSDANQIGVISVGQVSGRKTGGNLSVTVGTMTASVGSDADESNAATKAQARAANRIRDSLAEALPDNCAFVATVTTSTVSGVMYINSGTLLPASGKITPVTGFDNAYEVKGTTAIAVGVSGKYIPATANGVDVPTTSTAAETPSPSEGEGE